MHFSRSVVLAFLAASSLALGLGTAAARGGDDNGWCGHRAYAGKTVHAEKFQERLQQRQERLHKALKLSAAQEKDWQAFTQKVAPGTDDLKRPASEDFRKLTTPERLEKMLAFSQQHQKFMTARLEAVKTFYNTLSAEQKQTFDEFHRYKAPRKRERRRD
ncbi:MAG: Spy/CpxP family protein refolding chaperone [Zoogloeaceae bacterium]|jgi:hypothetical protein|nr:Spy/CpxP family protein refolding chaperone [Zoogloeaceae bacterium]